MVKNGFFIKYYLIDKDFAITDKTENKIIYLRNKNQKTKKLFSANEIIDILEVNNMATFDINCHGEKIDRESLKSSRKFIIELIRKHIYSLENSFNEYFEDEAIKEIIAFMPFIRLSNYDSNYIVTFFTYLKLFNNSNIFVISETIPSLDFSHENLLKYIDDCNTQVRHSVFIKTNIYEYLTEIIPQGYTQKRKIYINNYILNNFIKENLSLDLNNKPYKLIISSMGKVVLPNNKDDIISIKLEKDGILIGVNDISNYEEYSNIAIQKMNELAIFHNLYITFRNLVKKKKLYQNDYTRIKILCNLLNKYSIKYKIVFDKEEKEYINNYIKGNKYLLAAEIANILGGFCRGFFGPN